MVTENWLTFAVQVCWRITLLIAAAFGVAVVAMGLVWPLYALWTLAR